MRTSASEGGEQRERVQDVATSLRTVARLNELRPYAKSERLKERCKRREHILELVGDLKSPKVLDEMMPASTDPHGRLEDDVSRRGTTVHGEPRRARGNETMGNGKQATA